MRVTGIFLIMLVTLVPVSAQLPSRFLLYDIKDGLSQNSVHAIFRDRDGLVWIGTQDGLNSFDGKNFTVYRHSDDDSTSISDQFVLNIQEDRSGTIWIGTRNGLNAFNKRTKKFRRYYADEKERHEFQSTYSDIFIQPDGNILIKKDGLYSLNTVTGQCRPLEINSLKNINWLIAAAGKAWGLDASGNLYCNKNYATKEITVSTLFTAPVTDLSSYNAKAYGDSLLFIYSGTKIFIYDTRHALIRKEIDLPFTCYSLTVTGPDEIYACGDKGICLGGINRITEQISTRNANGNILPPGTVLSAFRDAEADLWIGTSGNGIAVSNKSFNNYQLIRSPVPNDAVTAITKSGNQLYMGTRSGLYIISGSSKNISSLLKEKSITALTVDTKGNIWAGIQGEGIIVIGKTGNIIKKISTGNDPVKNVVMNLCVNSKGMIAASTTGGFFFIDPDNGTISSPAEKLSGTYVMSAFEDRGKNIWVANNNGLDEFAEAGKKKASFISSDDKSSFIKRTIITSVTQDTAGAIWIGTIRNGIYKYEHGNFSHYTVSAGLASDVVYNVSCDGQNRIWATTSAGLDIFNASKNSFTTLSPADGIPASGFVFGAIYNDGDHIYFGTSEGMIICNTNDIILHETGIEAFVADVKVNGQSINIDNNSFKIMPDDKLISFELASSPAFFSGNIIYQYRLLGQHDEWITLPQGIHTVNYTGLPYKELTLQVRAAGSVNNLETAPVRSVTVRSKAPFWKTAIFIIAVILLFISFVIMMALEYNKRNFKKQLEQLKVEKELQVERIRIGRDLHDNIGAYTSALISGLDHIKTPDPEQQNNINGLKEYGSNIMGFLRETIWMLNSETLTVTAFADRFKNYTLRISKNYPSVDFRFQDRISNEKTLPPSLMLNLFRILQEALQNACKHSGASVITIVTGSEQFLYFEVRDNGCGFDKTEKEDRYGLNNMKQRADESGFIFELLRNDEGGTAVRLTENTANAALLTS